MPFFKLRGGLFDIRQLTRGGRTGESTDRSHQPGQFLGHRRRRYAARAPAPPPPPPRPPPPAAWNVDAAAFTFATMSSTAFFTAVGDGRGIGRVPTGGQIGERRRHRRGSAARLVGRANQGGQGVDGFAPLGAIVRRQGHARILFHRHGLRIGLAGSRDGHGVFAGIDRGAAAESSAAATPATAATATAAGGAGRRRTRVFSSPARPAAAPSPACPPAGVAASFAAAAGGAAAAAATASASASSTAATATAAAAATASSRAYRTAAHWNHRRIGAHIPNRSIEDTGFGPRHIHLANLLAVFIGDLHLHRARRLHEVIQHYAVGRVGSEETGWCLRSRDS